MGLLLLGWGSVEVEIVSGGNMTLKYGSVAAWISSGVSRSSKSRTGCDFVSHSFHRLV